jgi:peptide/nickel transport system substrate-binding protein
MTGLRRGRRTMALLALLALVSSACGGDDGGGEEAGPSSTEAPEAAADPAGVFKIGWDMVQSTSGVQLDPALANGNATSNDAIWYLVFGRFMRPTMDGGLEPDLAERATIVDPNTIEIVLRDGVTFSDGSPFDAAAVKGSLERVLANRERAVDAYLPGFFSLASVEATSPDTARLSFPDGTAASWFDQYISGWQTSILKPGASGPIGAGPMKVVTFEPEVSLVLEKNERYWNADAVKVAGVELVHIAFDQPQSGINALRSGQVDLVFTEPSQLSALSGNLKSYARVSPEQSGNLHICKKEGPLADPRVRKAINKAIDREAINEAVYQGTAEPATQMWPKGHRLNNPEVDDELAYDPEGAKKLLAEAGYADGVTVDVYPIAAFGLDDTAEVLQQQLAAVGVKVNLHAGANYVEDYLKPNRAGMGLYPSGVAGLQKLAAWVGDSIGNVCQYDDPELTAIHDQLAKVSVTTDEAVELWHQAAEIVVDDALGGFIIFRSVLAAYNTERIGNLVGWPLGQYAMPDPTKSYVKAD